MNRKNFIYKSAIITAGIMTLKHLQSFADNTPAAENPAPALFVGHGNPMNAIEDNEFSRTWKTNGQELSKPKAILCVSAHWQTRGTKVTAMEKPRTIHDFGGFPQKLFDVQYPAPGSPETADEIRSLVSSPTVEEDHEWGLDHGTWSVLKPMFPDADIPVLQLSLDYGMKPEQHLELAKQLAALRKKGIMIMGSGNIVHNLGMAQWNDSKYDWAVEFDQKVKELTEAGDSKSLANYTALGRAAQLSIPTPEHYLPLLYVLGIQEKEDQLTWFNDKVTMGAISMRSFVLNTPA